MTAPGEAVTTAPVPDSSTEMTGPVTTTGSPQAAELSCRHRSRLAAGITPRFALSIAVLAVAALVVPSLASAVLLVLLVAAAVTDIAAASAPITASRSAPKTVVRGSPSHLVAHAEAKRGCRVRLRQAVPRGIELLRPEQAGGLGTALVANRRGRHLLQPLAVRCTGPLGLGTFDHVCGGVLEVMSVPDLPGGRRLAMRRVARSEADASSFGPIGAGTDIEWVRDWSPDDDSRQINWLASWRAGRPMSNQYRADQQLSVVCLVDAGRLMAAPLSAGGPTRLDVALDCTAALAAAAEHLGDNAGATAFAEHVMVDLPPRRQKAAAIVRALFDLEATDGESNYDMALRSAGRGGRYLLVVLMDLGDQTSARSLAEALASGARRTTAASRRVIVAGATEPALASILTEPPESMLEVCAMSAALDLEADRARAIAEIRHTGAIVIEAPPEQLPAACTAAYMRTKFSRPGLASRGPASHAVR